MKHIIVTTDFSPASLSGLKIASYLARKKSDISIRLSHAYHVPRKPSVTNQDLGYDIRKQEKIRAGIKEKLHAIAKEDFVRGLKIETQIMPHMEVDELLNHKDNKQADLIIAGVKGNKEWQRSEEAKHTEAIIRQAQCPVLTVHETLPDIIKFDNIVFASDFSQDMYKAFPKMKKILDILDAKLHLIKVITQDNFQDTLSAEKEMKDFAKVNFITNYTLKVFNDENVELGILRYAYSIKADMIAMETHGKSGILHMLKGSILESVARHSEMPVLSISMNPEN